MIYRTASRRFYMGQENNCMGEASNLIKATWFIRWGRSYISWPGTKPVNYEGANQKPVLTPYFVPHSLISVLPLGGKVRFQARLEIVLYVDFEDQ